MQRQESNGKLKSNWQSSVVAGGTAGLVSSVATCPLDVVKTKLQAQRVAHTGVGYQGVAATVRNIFVHNGIRGFYRGLGPTVLGYLPTWAIYFAVYDGIKQHFGEAPLGATDVVQSQGRTYRIYPAAQAHGYQPAFRESPWALHILASVGAGAASTLCTTPLWVIKTRFMTQPYTEKPYKHTLDAFRIIYRSEGPLAFYRGLIPSLLGITHVVVQFPLYEQLKAFSRGSSAEPLPWPTLLLCSSTAKMVASVVTYPHEVVRTRLQIQRRPRVPPAALMAPSDLSAHPENYKGIIHTATRIVREEGARGLYKGLSINLLRTVPNSAVTMLTYELVMRHLGTLSNGR